MTYLDTNATTPISPEILKKVVEIYELGAINPSSSHALGKIAKRHLIQAKERILHALSASNDYDVIFTASGTEANNLALNGKNFATSAFEHESIRNLPNQKEIVSPFKPFTYNSKTQMEITSIIWANNITGIVHNIPTLAQNKSKYFHTDAVQFAGKRLINLRDETIDAITISGHKIHAPHIGCLVHKKSFPIQKLLYGGSQNEDLHAGTYNLPAIVGLSYAIEMVNGLEYLEKYQHRTQKLKDKLEDFVLNNGGIIIGKEFDRLSNTSCIAKVGILSTEQLVIMDVNGICVSIGSACSAGVVSKSYVLREMELEDSIISSALRISVGMGNNISDIEKFCKAWKGM